MPKQHELEKQGWMKRFTLDEPRLSETVQLYMEIGFDVHLEPFHPEEELECSLCMKDDPDRYRTIYTREKDLLCKPLSNDDEERCE